MTNKVVSIKSKAKSSATSSDTSATHAAPKRVHRTTSLSTMSERKKLFCDVIERLAEYDLGDVAKKANVSYSTLYNWCFGETISPILRTVLDVCEVIQLEVVLVDTHSNIVSTSATKKKRTRAVSA